MWEGRRLLPGANMTFISDDLGWILQMVHDDKRVARFKNCRWYVKYTPKIKTV